MKKFALIGENINYSLSSAIHAAILSELSKSAEYRLIEIEKGGIGSRIDELKSLDGFNVTQPHKKDIIGFLDTLDTPFGAVNTVLCDNGKLTGYNTDGFGFIESLKMSLERTGGGNEAASNGNAAASGGDCALYNGAGTKASSPLKNRTVLILGAGGMGSVAAAALLKEGANVYIYNRTLTRAKETAKATGAAYVESPDEIAPEILVNCISAPLFGDNFDVKTDDSRLKLFYDTIYKETAMQKSRSAAGIRTENGLAMLVLQAVRAEEMFWGLKLSANDVLRIAAAVQKRITAQK